MKQIKAIILLLLCTATLYAQSFDKSGADTLLLNGTWKFNTILGEGSSFRDIKPNEKDIIIDNSQKNLIEVNGKWSVKTKAERASVSWGEDYYARYFMEGDTSTNIRFKTNVAESGYYEHFIYYPFGHHLTTQINIKHNKGITTKHNSQRNRCNKWVSMGVFKLDKEKESYIEFTAVSDGGVVADAIMLRPIETQKYEKAQIEKQEVYQTNYVDNKWDDLLVPGHWGMLNQYSNYTGKGWYRKEIKILNNWKKASNERVRLKFEGVYHIANVYLNGKYLGKHQGGFTPFEFDVTEALDYNGKNILAVEADNSAIVGATWNWGGIIRDVYLVKNNDIRVKYQYIHAEPDLKTGEASFKLKVRIENSSNQTRTLDLKAEIIKNKSLLSVNKTVKVNAIGVTEIELEGKLDAKKVKLWHFDTPELYQLKTSVSEQAKVLHTRTDNFGIRKFEVTRTQMLLNGEPVRLAGFNRVSDHRFWGSSEPQEVIDMDIRLMKNAGANFMRIMHGTQNKKLIEACDREGILLFEEANVRELTNPEFVTSDYTPDYTLIKQWLTEMIERDINNPSIVGWSVGNELSHHYDYVKMIIPWVKENLDPYRSVTCVSNTGYRKKDSRANDPLQFSDIIMQNIYQKNVGKVMDTLHERWGEKAIFFSEFGVGRFTTPSLDHDIDKLAPWYNNMRDQRLYTTGTAMWTFNDYRSGYSQTLESENRAWGTVNAWRTKRRGYQTFQKESSPVKDIKVDKLDLKKRKASITIPIRSFTDYPSYTMRGYKIRIEFKDKTGYILSKYEKELPVLSPENEKWNGSIKWKKFKGEVFDITFTLLSTNGYTRYVKTISYQVPQQPTIEKVIAGKNAVRVLFRKEYGAEEHFVNYTVAGKQLESYKTIGNYIDIDSLENGKDISIELVAVNSNGLSKSSKSMKARLTNKVLPPVVWDGFIRHNMLVIGYSGEFEDETYTVKYGVSKDNMTQTIEVNNRGMLTVPLNGEKSVFFQIKRSTVDGESDWSNTVEARNKQFRIYK